jgi:hypothetical protein
VTGDIPGGAECRDLRVEDKQFFSGRDLHEISIEYKLSCEFLSNRISRTEKKLMLVKKSELVSAVVLPFLSVAYANQ